MFRQEALKHHGMRWRGRALLLPGLPIWLVTSICIFFLIAFLTFVIAGTYTRRVNVTGEITTYPRAVQRGVLLRSKPVNEKNKAGLYIRLNRFGAKSAYHICFYNVHFPMKNVRNCFSLVLSDLLHQLFVAKHSE